MDAETPEMCWIDVDGPIYAQMPLGDHSLAIYAREGLQVIRNIVPPYTFEPAQDSVRPADGMTRIRFSRTAYGWQNVTRTIVWKP